MWCRNCQQNVPAVAQRANGPLVCPRCEQGLSVEKSNENVAVGENTLTNEIPSSAFQESPREGLPLEILAQEQLQLRQIARKLGPVRKKSPSDNFDPHQATTPSIHPTNLRIHWSHTLPGELNSTPYEETHSGQDARCDAQVAAVGYQTRASTPRKRISWLLSLTLLGGVFSLTCGIGLMVHAMVLGHQLTWEEGLHWQENQSWQSSSTWQGGLTTTLAGEGMLIFGLTWMAIHLWRNGRKVNHQLQGVDQQLSELQYHSETKQDSQSSSSATYYDHFVQGASSQMLLANLRGGLDQLAKRMD